MICRVPQTFPERIIPKCKIPNHEYKNPVKNPKILTGKANLWCQFHQHFKTSSCTKSLSQEFTNSNCKHIKAAQRNLTWKSCTENISKIEIHTKALCTAFMSLRFGFVILWQKAFGAKAALKTLVKLPPGGRKWQLIFPHFKSFETFSWGLYYKTFYGSNCCHLIIS